MDEFREYLNAITREIVRQINRAVEDRKVPQTIYLSPSVFELYSPTLPNNQFITIASDPIPVEKDALQVQGFSIVVHSEPVPEPPCSHPPEKLSYHIVSCGYNDDYGSWVSMKADRLKCHECGKEALYRERDYGQGSSGLSLDEYHEFTGRGVTFDELKILYKENNDLFHTLNLKTEFKEDVMNGFHPGIRKVIRRLRMEIKGMEEQIEELTRTYEGRE